MPYPGSYKDMNSTTRPNRRSSSSGNDSGGEMKRDKDGIYGAEKEATRNLVDPDQSRVNPKKSTHY